MPTLTGLPNEILTAIIEAIEPDDIMSFSNCCKLIHSLAKDRIEEHKKKKNLFSELVVEDYFLPDTGQLWDKKYSEPSTYLKEFFSDERNRLYPYALMINDVVDGVDAVDVMNGLGVSRAARTSANAGLNDVRNQLKRAMAEVHSTMGLDFGGNEAEEWGKQVEAGYPMATFLFLLALLPNLEKFTLDISDYWFNSRESNTKIMRHMTETVLMQKERALGFCRKLSECEVDGGLYEGIGESLLPFLMMLPRMQKIWGQGLDIQGSTWPYSDAVSPVVDLALEGAMDSLSLSSYIRGIRELKRFRFTHLFHAFIDWEPCGILATLRQFAFKSLAHLDLTTNVSFETSQSYNLPGIGSLRSFEVLETIRLQYVLLFLDARAVNNAGVVNLARSSENLCDDPRIQGQKLIDFLPPSARTFRLEDIARRSLILGIFKGFSEHRVERLPKLELISIDANDGIDADDEINNQIKKICGESGVQMEVRRTDLDILR